MKPGLSFLIIVLLSCNSESGTGISENDAKALSQLHEDYKKFWLQNDSAKVVDLFLENGEWKIYRQIWNQKPSK